MGLDTVELVMKVEKTFGINIPDQEAEQISTVGDLHEAVWRYIDGKNSETCQSQALFYRLRQAFTDCFQLPRQDFRPNTLMEDILPKHNRRQVYANFEQAIQLELPELTFREPWRSLITYFIIIVGGVSLVGTWILAPFDYFPWFWISLLVSFIVIIILCLYLLKPLQTAIMQHTVREFTYKVFSLNYDKLNRMDGVHRKDMETVINHIIVDISGAELHEVTPEKRICDDLGMD